MTTQSSLEVCDVTKRYDRVRALAGISVKLEAGRVCALLGPNGAGKSTLLGVISTLIRPSKGAIRYTTDGNVVPPNESLRRRIGIVAHDSLVYRELTGIENLAFYAKLYEIPDAAERIETVLAQVGLEPQAHRRRAQTYSRGMTQRLALARALLHKPDILLFDEPFTGLDHGGSTALTQVVSEARSRGCIVLAATHNLEAIADVTDHVLILRRGKVACDQRVSTEASGSSFSYSQLKQLYHEYAN